MADMQSIVRSILVSLQAISNNSKESGGLPDAELTKNELGKLDQLFNQLSPLIRENLKEHENVMIAALKRFRVGVKDGRQEQYLQSRSELVRSIKEFIELVPLRIRADSTPDHGNPPSTTPPMKKLTAPAKPLSPMEAVSVEKIELQPEKKSQLESNNPPVRSVLNRVSLSNIAVNSTISESLLSPRSRSQTRSASTGSYTPRGTVTASDRIATRDSPDHERPRAGSSAARKDPESTVPIPRSSPKTSPRPTPSTGVIQHPMGRVPTQERAVDKQFNKATNSSSSTERAVDSAPSTPAQHAGAAVKVVNKAGSAERLIDNQAHGKLPSSETSVGRAPVPVAKPIKNINTTFADQTNLQPRLNSPTSENKSTTIDRPANKFPVERSLSGGSLTTPQSKSDSTDDEATFAKRSSGDKTIKEELGAGSSSEAPKFLRRTPSSQFSAGPRLLDRTQNSDLTNVGAAQSVPRSIERTLSPLLINTPPSSVPRTIDRTITPQGLNLSSEDLDLRPVNKIIHPTALTNPRSPIVPAQPQTPPLSASQSIQRSPSIERLQGSAERSPSQLKNPTVTMRQIPDVRSGSPTTRGTLINSPTTPRTQGTRPEGAHPPALGSFLQTLPVNRSPKIGSNRVHIVTPSAVPKKPPAQKPQSPGPEGRIWRGRTETVAQPVAGWLRLLTLIQDEATQDSQISFFMKTS